LLSNPDAGGAAEGLRDYAKHFDWFARAPVVIAVSTRRPESFLTTLCGEDAIAVQGGAVSAAMAAQNLMLAAHAMGLGTCCLTGPLAAGSRLKEILRLGVRRELVCLITLGYPEGESAAPGRRPVDEIMRYVR
jgi:nitroreductase